MVERTTFRCNFVLFCDTTHCFLSICPVHKRINVAWGCPASQWGGTRAEAVWAVDGVADPGTPALPGNCLRTGHVTNGGASWWSVDLRVLHTVVAIGVSLPPSASREY